MLQTSSLENQDLTEAISGQVACQVLSRNLELSKANKKGSRMVKVTVVESPDDAKHH